MSMTIEDSINMMILEGKTFTQIEWEILSKWHPEKRQDGYDMINKKLLAGDFKVSRAEAKKLRPELFDCEDDTDFYMAGEDEI